MSNPPLTTPSGLPGSRTPESFTSTNFFSPCSRYKKNVNSYYSALVRPFRPPEEAR
nr:MAG TPA: hypothetical protein [Caudoviricetes sp.]